MTQPTPPLTAPKFEEDIFINYAQLDNRALALSNRGWIDYMHELLDKRLGELMGGQPRIWRDVKLRGHQQLTKTIIERLTKTASLVSVISPSYVRSDWCKKELNVFYKCAPKSGGIKLDNLSRIFKVVKTPIKDKDLVEAKDLEPTLLELLQESLGYEFYEVDRMSGRPTEFTPGPGEEMLIKYLKKLEDLAQDIKEFIECQRASKKLGYSVNIFLAETTPELKEWREEIRRELQLRGYRVLPGRNFSTEGADYQREAADLLKQSVLSIHLIGADYTTIPASKEDSMRLRLEYLHKVMADRVRLQHELAMERGLDDGQFSRIVWMPKELEAREPAYGSFIDYLRNDPGVYDGAEVLCGSSPEDLKTIIQKKLATYKVVTPAPRGRKCVYLIYEKQDAEAVSGLIARLGAGNYEVTTPFKQGAGAGHKETQRQCDAILIFYGNSSDYSIDMKLKEVRKNETLRQKPLLAKGVYVGGRETEQKKGFTAADDVVVMKNFAEVTSASLDPFLESIEKNEARAAAAKGWAVA
ncbi:MAG TPA: hypothetical protein VF591_07080 [Pyrinomonadaceae bacterium]|jgi:hypothetical protein